MDLFENLQVMKESEANNEEYSTFTNCPNCNTRFDVEEADTDVDLVYTGENEYDKAIYYQCPKCKKWFTEKDLGVTLEAAILKDDKDIEEVVEASILKDEKDMEEVVEQKIIKDEKDIEQVVEGTQTLTEDFEGSKEMFTKKAKKFADMVDALAKIISEDELHEFLKNLSVDLDMDVYTSGDRYPFEPDGYFSGGSLDDLDLSNEDDGAEFDWVYKELTDSITKINAKITSVIDELKGKIASLELVL